MNWTQKRRFYECRLFKVSELFRVLEGKFDMNTSYRIYDKMGFIEFLPPFIQLQEDISRGVK